MTNPLDRDDLRARVQAAVEAELATQRQVLAEVGPDLAALVDVIERLLRGGKRVRAAFAYWGYRAGGAPGTEAAVRLGTAMEFFQAAALLHDDVMDGSDTRRGMPAAHRAVAAWHAEQGWAGDSDRFGAAAATLAGDLCLQWADEVYAACGLAPEQLSRARGTFDRMRTQLMGGQYLDLLESARGWEGLDLAGRLASARRVIRFKSAGYTIQAPLLIGAHAGGVPAAAFEPLSAYGLALGAAFQLRDDQLGVFGDPSQTGKPAGDDLREGKRTVLLAYALDAADAGQARTITRLLGDPGLDAVAIESLRAVIVDTGAAEQVEQQITQLCQQARAALGLCRADLDAAAAAVLDELVDVTTARTS